MTIPNRRQVIVLGMHRSGTSALTGLLSACGLYVGAEDELTKPGAENPKGFFERRDTRAICDALLHAADADWWKVSDFDVERVPPAALIAQGREIRRVVEVLDAKGPWALKEPRLCVLLPIFRRYLRDPAAVIVYRNPLEVARSLRHRNGFPQGAALALWEAYTVALLRNSADMPRVFVSYDDLVANADATARALEADLATIGVGDLETTAASDAIVAGYRHERADPELFDLLLTEPQKRLWRHLATREGEAPVLELSRHSRILLREFEADRTEALRAREELQGRHVQAVEKGKRLAEEAQTLAQRRDAEVQARKTLQEKLVGVEARRKAEGRRAAEAEDRAGQLAGKLLKQSTEHAVAAIEQREWRRRAERLEKLRDGEETARRAERRKHDQTELALAQARSEAATLRSKVEAAEKLALICIMHWRRFERKLPRLAAEARPQLAAIAAARSTGGMPVASTIQTAPAYRSRSWTKRLFGRFETAIARRKDLALLRGSALFDPAWYKERYPDVARSQMDPLRHYLLHGGFEGRDPSAGFSSSWYLSRYKDVLQSGINPLAHYVRYGRRENRLPVEPAIAAGGAKPAAARSSSEPGRPSLAAPARAPSPAPIVLSASRAARPVADVDVIVPVHNALDDVRKCLASLRRHHDGFTVRVLVVNDGSDKETSAFLRSYCQTDAIFDLIDLGANQGYTRAINHGLRASAARYVITLNSDTVVTTGWLGGMIRCAESDPAIGIVGPLSNAASWQNVPQLLDDEGKVFAINSLPADMNADQMARLVASASTRAYPRTPFVNGFCYLIKREVIDAIGLLDEENFPVGYGEENDYSIRAREVGFDLAIADDAYVFHAKSKSFGHERRTELSKQGSERLKAKHTPARVNALIERVKQTGAVDPIRRRVTEALAARDTARETAPTAETMRVLFLLPAGGGGGGVHSIVQEVDEMRRMGVTAHVAIREKDHSSYLELYSDIAAARELFVPFGSDDLPAIAAAYDVVVATIFTSVAMLKALVDANPRLVPAYYVQDYEPLFFAEDDPNRAIAELSYELIPGMLVFAKTQWLVDTIRERHGVEVKKVAPSLDHAVYRPRPELRSDDGRVHVAAMIRPRTPRRGAERTMRVLARLAQAHGDKVAVSLFGCRDDDADFQALERDFPFRNFGVLSRPEVAEVLAASDIFVDLSDYQAFGRTGLEAMACGCVPMVPVHGGTSEYAVHKENSLVVDPLDENVVLQSLIDLIGQLDMIQQMKSAAIDVASRYNVRLAARDEIDVITSKILDQVDERELSHRLT